MKITKKQIYAIDAAILILTLLVIISLVGNVRPLVIEPIDNLQTLNTSVLFSFEKGNAIYIDDNQEFTSPEKVYAKDNLVINLKPGKYYWKVEGILSSEIRSLTIQSEVDLKLKEAGNNYEVVNSGNTRLKVNLYNDNTLVGNVILDVDKSANVSGNKFIGEQNE